MKVAMVSYNRFVRGEENSWGGEGDNRVLLIQDDISDTPNYKEYKESLKATVPQLYELLKNELPTIDRVIVYVGFETRYVIELAAKYGLAPDRAIFVLCDCNLTEKMKVLKECGFSSSKVVLCECGGVITMGRIYRDFLAHGILP